MLDRKTLDDMKDRAFRSITEIYGEKGLKASCPACGADSSDCDGFRVFICPNCGAVYNEAAEFLPQEAVANYVESSWDSTREVEDLFYFDLCWLHAGRLRRSHGWANPVTRKVVQTG